jgi:hypothetical protein
MTLLIAEGERILRCMVDSGGGFPDSAEPQDYAPIANGRGVCGVTHRPIVSMSDISGGDYAW